MHVGTTHVAVGFTDMSTLLHGSRVAGDSADRDGPLRWVGFEMSAYACAKTAVIACMLSQGAAVDEVLQVIQAPRPHFGTAAIGLSSPHYDTSLLSVSVDWHIEWVVIVTAD